MLLVVVDVVVDVNVVTVARVGDLVEIVSIAIVIIVACSSSFSLWLRTVVVQFFLWVSVSVITLAYLPHCHCASPL